MKNYNTTKVIIKLIFEISWILKGERGKRGRKGDKGEAGLTGPPGKIKLWILP